MARIPPVNRITLEDFSTEQRAWIGKLITPINTFFQQVTSALNGQLTFGENISGQSREMEFVFVSASDYPKFKHSLAVRPNSFQIVNAFENADSVIFLGAFGLEQGDIVALKSAAVVKNGAISALAIGAKYKFLLRISP